MRYGLLPDKDETWDVFLGSKRRTAQTHYRLERKCEKCGIFITDNNKSGLCQRCLIKKNAPEFEAHTPESEAHKALKQQAKAWLKEIGCTDIREEHRISKFKRNPMIFVQGEGVVFDVSGYYDNKLVVVECGGSQERKLEKALRITPYIYILPYNYMTPFRYHKEYKMCNLCGNIKGVKSRFAMELDS